MKDRTPLWLEITPDFRCNNRCVGCFSVSDDGGGMSSRDVAAVLREGRDLGARGLWFGGGEPTLRRDVLKLVKHARKLGYERVKLQTNGMMLSYPKFTSACVEAIGPLEAAPRAW